MAKEKLKIALLSSFTMDLFPNYLTPLLEESGWEAEFYVAGFDQYKQEILDSESHYYSFKPEITILFLPGEDLFKDILASPLDFDKENLASLAKSRWQEIEGLVSKILRQMPENIVLINNIFFPPLNCLTGLEHNTDFSLDQICQFYNQKLSCLTKNISNLYVIDYQKLVGYFGYKNFVDQRLWYLARMRLNSEALKELARFYIAYIKAIKGKRKKCLVLDLDNTLWGGIIGEDGTEGIKLGEDGLGGAYVDFQREILNLYEKGIILAIDSKNNFEDAKEMFEKHPSMVLKKGHFATMKINWKDKVTNLREIAVELNIGLSSFVFLDDNPAERELIKKRLPEVVVAHLPDDPSFLRDFILKLELEHFPTVSVTEEDRKRGELYKSQVQRVSLRKSVSSLEDFYRSLEMQAIIREGDTFTIPRMTQLTQRTNQFNLTTRRHTESDIKSFIEDPSYRVYNLELIDKFGSNGIVGLMVLRNHDEVSWNIDTFLLSCRVIGRTVEDAFIAYVTNKLKTQGVKRFRGEYISTRKNSLVKNLYEQLGFDKIVEKEGTTIWEIHLKKKEINFPPWIEIIEHKKPEEIQHVSGQS